MAQMPFMGLWHTYGMDNAPILPQRFAAALDVLAVDDDEITRVMISTVLNKHGIPTATACDGAQMWDVLGQTTPRLILLDVEMPGEDGFTLAQALRIRYGLGVIIVMLTARAKDFDKNMGLDLRVDDYLTKPCDLSQVLFLVRRYLATEPPQSAETSHPTTCAVCGGKLDHTLRSAAGSVLSCFVCGWSRYIKT
jgi:DNA-binding response OmpR family regulator